MEPDRRAAAGADAAERGRGSGAAGHQVSISQLILTLACFRICPLLYLFENIKIIVNEHFSIK